MNNNERVLDKDGNRIFYVEGIEYHGYDALAKKYNVSKAKLYDRISSGWTIEEACELEPRKKKPSIQVVLNGKLYESYEELSKDFHIPVFRIYQRIYNGWSIEEAVGLIKHVRGNTREFNVNGKVYYGYDDLSEEFNIPAITINNRIMLGWTIEEACELVERPVINAITYNIDGKNYYGARMLSETFGVDKGVIKYRLKNNWDIKEAVELLPHLPPKTEDGLKIKFKHTLKFDSIEVISFAYDTDSERYYECKDNENIKIYSKTYLIQKWKEWKGI